jgi:hypothetical protein
MRPRSGPLTYCVTIDFIHIPLSLTPFAESVRISRIGILSSVIVFILSFKEYLMLPAIILVIVLGIHVGQMQYITKSLLRDTYKVAWVPPQSK